MSAAPSPEKPQPADASRAQPGSFPFIFVLSLLLSATALAVALWPRVGPGQELDALRAQLAEQAARLKAWEQKRIPEDDRLAKLAQDVAAVKAALAALSGTQTTLSATTDKHSALLEAQRAELEKLAADRKGLKDKPSLIVAPPDNKPTPALVRLDALSAQVETLVKLSDLIDREIIFVSGHGGQPISADLLREKQPLLKQLNSLKLPRP